MKTSSRILVATDAQFEVLTKEWKKGMPQVPSISKEGRYSMCIGSSAPVYLATVLEYSAVEVLKIAGNTAREGRSYEGEVCVLVGEGRLSVPVGKIEKPRRRPELGRSCSPSSSSSCLSLPTPGSHASTPAGRGKAFAHASFYSASETVKGKGKQGVAAYASYSSARPPPALGSRKYHGGEASRQDALPS
ncbi:putative histone H2A-4 [Nymphaea thermarum]|nr:putative histone H2A-4 [Nymphaea thermarum]